MNKSDFFAEARTDLSGPLSGVTVLEATTTWAGPMCGSLLADLGADVIKVEPPHGDVSRFLPPFLPGTNPPLSFMHASVNRNKRSVVLDLRQPPGRELFLKLAAGIDVIVENFRPGKLDRRGLGYQGVRQVNPDIIYVSISGFGQFGSLSHRAGYDVLAQAYSGFLSLSGEPGGEPIKPPTFLSDDLGGLHGALAAVAAIRHRDRTGEGQYIDIALLDSMLFQSNGNLALAAMDVELPRTGNEFVFNAPSNLYRCRDGYVMLVILVDHHWKLLAPVIGRPELAEHPDYATNTARLERRTELNHMLSQWFAARTVEEAADLLEDQGLAFAPVRAYAQSVHDPHVIERDMLQTTEQDGTALLHVGPPAKMSRTPLKIRSAAPALGQHTDEVLDQLGIDAAARHQLREAKVI
ncbi:MAG TPA: CoA transferase [Candidatus Binataceae bacterium]|jgi:formyl-CoA transferase|nr:CoA transferase [Candidatus Binataceae bacterium]